MRGIDLAEVGPLPLHGEWAFYWDELLPAALAARLPADEFFDMPSTWDSRVGSFGAATFVLGVRLPVGTEEIALWVPNASTAHRLYVDGALVAQSGTPGPSRITSVPRYRMNRPVVPVRNDRITLVLQVSNFHHRRGGMWRPIDLGTPRQMSVRDNLEVMYDLMLIGSFLGLTIYNLFLYSAGKRRNRGPLLLAALFLVLTLRMPVMGQMIITRLIPGFSWFLQLTVEYFTAQLAWLTFTWALYVVFPRFLPRWYPVAVTVFVTVNALALFIGGVPFYSLIMPYYVWTSIGASVLVAGLFVWHALRRRQGAATGIAAVLVFFLVSLSETVHYSGWILSRDFAPLGFLVGLFAQGSITTTTVNFVFSIVMLVIIFTVANLLVLRTSRSLFGAGSAGGGGTSSAQTVPQDRRGQAHEEQTREGRRHAHGLAPPARWRDSSHQADSSLHAEDTEATDRSDEADEADAADNAVDSRFNPNGHFGLTKREQEITRLISAGHSNKEIAHELFISEGTVKAHVYRIMRKMGVHNRVALANTYRAVSEQNYN